MMISDADRNTDSAASLRSSNDILRKARQILANGKWGAGIVHNPPKRGRKNTMWDSKLLRIPGDFDTEASAKATAAAYIKSGWCGCNPIDQSTAKPLVSFRLSSDDLDNLVREIGSDGSPPTVKETP